MSVNKINEYIEDRTTKYSEIYRSSTGAAINSFVDANDLVFCIIIVFRMCSQGDVVCTARIKI